MLDLNKMSLEDVLKYCEERDKWYLQLFIDCEGYENALTILADNGKI